MGRIAALSSPIATDRWSLRLADRSPADRDRVRGLRALQIALGLLWLLDGALQSQPLMFSRAFVTKVIAPNAAGQPALVAQPIVWMGHLIEPRVALFNAFAAALQMLIGAGLLYRRTVKVALIASFAWAFGVWWFGEGLGMLLTGDASPLTGAPGAVLLYVLIGAIVWPGRDAGKAPRDGGLLGIGGARAAWAALWLLAAWLWLAPANRGAQATHDALAAAPNGMSWLASIQAGAADAAAGNGLAIAIAMAALCAAIGVAVLLDWRPRAFLALACLIAFAWWLLGQGLGGIFTGSATDPGTGPLLLLLAASLRFTLPRGIPQSTARRDPGRQLAYTVNGRSYRPVALR
jgi:hypothetical protein